MPPSITAASRCKSCYTGAIETAEEFGKRIYLEAWKRGWSRAQKKVVVGDGAEWIWNLAAEHFPGAIQSVDLYHARQHLWELARRLHPHDEVSQKAWMKIHQKRLLDKGEIEKLVELLRSIDTGNPEMAEKIRFRGQSTQPRNSPASIPETPSRRSHHGSRNWKSSWRASSGLPAMCRNSIIGIRLTPTNFPPWTYNRGRE